MSPPSAHFSCEIEGDRATLRIDGQIDHPTIALMLQCAAPAARVVIDLAQARGAYSTLLAACIQLAIAHGGRIEVRGADRRFSATLQQMHLERMIGVIAGEGGI